MTDDIFPGDGPLTREEMGAIVLSLEARYQRFVGAVERHHGRSDEAPVALVTAVQRYHEQMQAATADLVATLEASL